MIQISLPDAKQETLLKSYVSHLSEADKQYLAEQEPPIHVTAFIDGRGLACPMPLLKTKVALRSMQAGDSIYVLATDPNSQTDLSAFCKQQGLHMRLSTQSKDHAKGINQGSEKLDTIFHLMITNN